MLGQTLEPGIYEIEAAFAGESGDREHLREFEFFAVALNERKQMRLWGPVVFIQQQIDGPVKTPRPFDSEAIAGTEIHGRIGNQRDNIDAFERVLKLVHHLAAEDIFWFVDSGRIDEDDLSVVAIQNSLNAIACG